MDKPRWSRADAEFCAEQLRRLDRDRYLTTLFAPAAARERLIALYAFNTEVARVGETVSEPIIGQMRLQWWRDAIAEVASGTPRKHPVVAGLVEVLAVGIAPEDFEPILVGRERDLEPASPADLAALEDYAEATSATLVRLAVRLLGADDEATHAAARHVGIAWALVGVLRAVPFLAQRRRSLLPADLVAATGLDLDALHEGRLGGRSGAALAAVAQAVATCAESHLALARRARASRAARAALLPASLAHMHLRRLARADFALFDPGLRRPDSGAWRLLLAWLRGSP
jgi:phytoene synthase